MKIIKTLCSCIEYLKNYFKKRDDISISIDEEWKDILKEDNLFIIENEISDEEL
tara:strand:+ start:394 stop:555 length:162 start_codon:yes stop_codon:yes gene_type:complete